jgi:hypothetical protein
MIGRMRVLALAAAATTAGCYDGVPSGRADGEDDGTADDGEGGTADDGGSETGDPALECAPGWVGMHRLNRREYANTLADLLGVEPSVADALPLDAAKGGFDNNASALGITPELAERYLAIAEAAVPAALEADPDRFVACTPATEDFADACVQATLVPFAERAWRRELDDAMRGELETLWTAAAQNTDGFTAAVVLAFEGVLISPAFLYRNALPEAGADAVQPLDDFDLASRLSYFVWSSMPDDALFDRARAGELSDEAVLREEVRRMLLDPRASDFVSAFTRQWLDIGGLSTKVFDPVQFPTVDADLLTRMQAESAALVEHVIRNDLPASELLTASYSFLDARLAAHYGIAGPTGDVLEQTPVPADQRRGIVTHGSVLAASAHPDRTSIPARGMWVMDNLLCLPPPPPPPAEIDMSGFEEEGEPTTQRERLEQHREDPTCAGCHVTMDNLGFGLENYDAVGIWRDTENGIAVDSSGLLPDGREFTNPMQLADLLATDPLYSRCMSQNLLSYGIGRIPTADDTCVLDLVMAAAGSPDTPLVDVVVEIVASDAFRYQGAEEDSP